MDTYVFQASCGAMSISWTFLIDNKLLIDRRFDHGVPTEQRENRSWRAGNQINLHRTFSILGECSRKDLGGGQNLDARPMWQMRILEIFKLQAMITARHHARSTVCRDRKELISQSSFIRLRIGPILVTVGQRKEIFGFATKQSPESIIWLWAESIQ